MPDVFFYIDYIPRRDLWTDVAYLDRYYEPVNARAIALAADDRLSPFISKNLYMRQAQSHTSACYMAKPTTGTFDLIEEVADEMLTRWFGWLDAANPVAAAERPALAERDLFIRRTIAERDPANAIGDRLFGPAFSSRLVRALWGGDRHLPRPIEH